ASVMITVHHLNNSRSQRILWLLEELGLEYEIVHHTRQPIGLAPAELKAIHPLGKAPIVEIDGYVMAESGAAVELITLRHGRGRLMPDQTAADYPRYIEMLHYPEGSAAGPLAMMLFGRLFRVENQAYHSYVAGQVELHIGYIDGLLHGREFLIGDQFSAADIQLTFTLQMARRSKLLEERTELLAYIARMEEREAYKRAIDKGGPFTLNLR
ncbi:MAG: glutathione S-transferase family protein, partial [Polyangiales bacterium]